MRVARLVCAAAGLFVSAASIDAQVVERPMRMGIMLGVSSSTVTDLDIEPLVDIGVEAKTSRRNAFQFGAFATLPFGSMFAFQPEAHFIKKGVKLSVASGDEEVPAGAELALNLSYLEVPLLLRLDVPREEGVRPFFLAGPTVAIRASCQFEFTFEGFNVKSDCDQAEEFDSEDPGDPFEKIDMGALLGAGIEGRMMGAPISVQARYQIGFKRITKEGFDTVNPKNSNISLLFGISF